MKEANPRDTLLVRAAERFSESNWAPLVPLLPHIGGSIAFFLSQTANKHWRERIESLFHEMGLRMKEVDASKIDKEYINSEEFESLIVRTIRMLEWQHEKEKIQIFASILNGVALIQHSADIQKQRYIRLVDQMSITHIAILRTMAKGMLGFGPSSQPTGIVILTADEIARDLDLDRVTVEAFCADLMANGILYDPQLGIADYKRGSYALHSSAMTFIQFVMDALKNDNEGESGSL